MMTSSRPAGDFGGSFATRRGHSSQLSISDPSHHVTEAIGTLYGDEDDSGSDSGRPLSFVGGPSYQDHIYRQPLRHEPHNADPRRHLHRSQSDQPPGPSTSNVEMGSLKKAQTLPIRSTSQRSPHSYDHGPKSPANPSLRDFQADASQFPLTNIDNPSDIAQELSNLQALRRLSMDVGSLNDPDMPPMTLSTIPAIAPSGDDDEADPSRLLWVPARVHPELAPTEFQTFLEKRVQSIRRRSGESMLSADGDLHRSNSGSSLAPGSIRRQKSKLSRQIDNSGGRGAMGYVDGAERLERKRSGPSSHSRELSLDDLVNDPTMAVKKLAQESQDQVVTGEGSNDDKPILPMAPGMGLRRSTRTTYRKGGSLRSGERPFSRRLASRGQDSDASDPGCPAVPEAPPGHSLTRVHSEPISDNYSRPNRSVRRQNKFSQEPLPTVNVSQEEPEQSQTESYGSSHQPGQYDDLPLRTSSSASRLTGQQGEGKTHEDQSGDQYDDQHSHHQNDYARAYPQRSSSQTTALSSEPQSHAVADEPPPRSSRRTAPASSADQYSQQQPAQNQYNTRTPSTSTQPQNLSDSLAGHPGAAASRTDSLTFIPTLNQEDRRTDKKPKRDDDAGSVTSTKSSGSGWKWFKSGTEDKEKKKEDAKKSKTKSLVEKAQDNVRLDVIQNSIDKTAPKGRESLVLDRDNVDSKLQEERKKDGSRKSDGKKEKDGSIFSSIFGGSKRKEEKEKTSKKSRHLEVPDEPVYKPLQPDVDYHWTRFPLLEERAIYRMAHIKLANPRRSLLSQVLLSNFMYSYLAIVQAMHPQMNVPTSPQQKRLEEEARRKQQEEEYLAQQQQDDQDGSGLDQYDYDYHRAAVQYADSGNGQVDYVDDAQIYEDEHGRDHQNDYAYEGSDAYGQGSKEYYQYHGSGDDRRHDRRDDMW